MNKSLPQLQAPETEAIVLGQFILLDVAARLEGREQTKHIILMQL